MDKFKEILEFSEEELALNRKGKISSHQRKKIKEETSSAVRDLFYIAIVFPTVLIVSSSVILLIWLFINSPELIREVALGSLGIAFIFYLVRKVLLRDLWDSSTVHTYLWTGAKAKGESKSPDKDETLYSNETEYPFHIPTDLEKLISQVSTKYRIYYNPTHKKILSMEEE